mmetsp:Transcript_4611/g.10119  ORF Transcript_4611/g.10119 Transcript_4611/m.10119 type:complete len:215 (+) Transcript_4611:534-1178(+)
MPMMQPRHMPIAEPAYLAVSTLHNFIWLCESPGPLRPMLTRADSIGPAVARPITSEIMLPMPAAHMVVRPKWKHMVASIKSPARIMMKLSMKPKPIIGKPANTARRHSCQVLGAGTSESLPWHASHARKSACLPGPSSCSVSCLAKFGSSCSASARSMSVRCVVTTSGASFALFGLAVLELQAAGVDEIKRGDEDVLGAAIEAETRHLPLSDPK